MNNLSAEIPKKIHLIDFKNNTPLPPKISIPDDEISAHLWQDWIKETGDMGPELVRVISEHSGNLLHSKIFRGTPRHPGTADPATIEPAGFYIPVIPHGIS